MDKSDGITLHIIIYNDSHSVKLEKGTLANGRIGKTGNFTGSEEIWE